MATLALGGRREFTARLPSLLAVYRAAFLEVYEDDPESATNERKAIMRRHADRDDLVLATAEDGSGLLGFCYSYRGGPGQWWHDVVARALGPVGAHEWVASCREIAECHVRPDAQGRGLGRTLLRATLTGAAEQTAALSVLDLPDTRARRLYASEGFVPLLTGFQFPGTATVYAILGKKLTATEVRPKPHDDSAAVSG